MTRSSRFAVGVHVLTLLAHEERRALTSDYIAGSVNTNPVHIRRILGLLLEARLVRTTEGAGGGTALAVSASKITLAQVFRAVEQGGWFALPPHDPNPLCPVGRCVQTILHDHLKGFEAVIEQAMGKVTIADMLKEVKTQGRK